MGELDELMAGLDTNGDGVLTKDELKGFLTDLNYTDEETEDTIDAWIEYADSNGDGVLDKSEMAELLYNWVNISKIVKITFKKI